MIVLQVQLWRFYEYVYWTRLRFLFWAGVLVCGFRTRNEGSEETPPTCRIAVCYGQGESFGNGAETKRPTGHGDDTLVMSSAPDWNR